LQPSHTIHAHEHHLGWDRRFAPVRRIAPGDTVAFACLDASNGQIDEHSDVGALAGYDAALVNPVTGPIAIDGARPGDALRVRVLDLAPVGWGWTAILPGVGLLADDFPDPWLNIARYDEREIAFRDGIRLPTRPFLGTLGVAPAVEGLHSVIPPRRVGGNLDCRDVIEGAVVTLPIEVEDALFSVGDPHAAQGEGEVCGTAIETPMQVRLSFELVRDGAPSMPHLDVPPGPLRSESERGWWVQTGVGTDLHQAARDAVRGTIDRVVAETRLDAATAYALCSVAGDLRVSEIVNAPNWVVSMALPRAVLD
jgi:acetamidase/formamidase